MDKIKTFITKNKVIAIIVAAVLAVGILIGSFFVIRALTMSDDEKAEQKIPALVNRYVDAMNNEDIDAYLECMKLDEVTLEKNQSSLKIMFEVYDLKTSVKSIDVTSIDAANGTGTVRVVTAITNQSKTTYQDCENTVDFELVYDKDTDKWYLGTSTLVNTTYTK